MLVHGKRGGRRGSRGRLGFEVEELGEQLGARDPVDGAVVDLGDHRDLTPAQAFGRCTSPTALGPVQLATAHVTDELGQLLDASRRGKRPAADVVLDVECRVVDPVRVAQAEGDLHQSPAEDRGQLEPGAHKVAQLVEGVAARDGGRVEHRRHRDVHVQAGCLQVQERRIEPCELFHGRFALAGRFVPPRRPSVARPFGVRHLPTMSQDGAMAWAWVYLAVSLAGALLVVNAFRPLGTSFWWSRAFFAGWYTAEMPLWHIAWQGAATVAFGLEGALGSWPGWVALGVNAASWTGLVVHARVSAGARSVFLRAEEEMPVPASDIDDLPLHGGDTMWRLPRLLYPLPRPARSMQVVRNVDYVGDGLRAHRLDIIRRRADPPKGAPVLVYIHGGAWVIGDKREQGLPLLHELARRGWVTVTINYRLSPRATWPDHIVDCKRAVAWVREHIAEYGGDPRFIAVSGGSAGGHLSSLLALTPGDVDFQPGFEGPTPRWTSAFPFMASMT